MSQKLCRRVGTLERINAAALSAMRDRERNAKAQASADELKRQIEAWRAKNSGPEHRNESLFETCWPAALRICLQEPAARNCRIAHRSSLSRCLELYDE